MKFVRGVFKVLSNNYDRNFCAKGFIAYVLQHPKYGPSDITLMQQDIELCNIKQNCQVSTDYHEAMDLKYFKQIEIEPLAYQHGERINAKGFLKDYVYINILGEKVLCRSAPIARLYKLLYSCI